MTNIDRLKARGHTPRSIFILQIAGSLRSSKSNSEKAIKTYYRIAGAEFDALCNTSNINPEEDSTFERTKYWSSLVSLGIDSQSLLDKMLGHMRTSLEDLTIPEMTLSTSSSKNLDVVNLYGIALNVYNTNPIRN